MFLSNEEASKVLGLLGIQISNDTIQRLYDRTGFVDDPDVEEAGIDDVAILPLRLITCKLLLALPQSFMLTFLFLCTLSAISAIMVFKN